MEEWISRPGWPADFHAPLYRILAELKSGGLSPECWRHIVDHLASWRATRPLTKAAIVQRGTPVLGKLAQEAEAIINASRPQPPNLDTCKWEQVAGLYEVASWIKGLSTPVFGSKLCHFILPDAFPVIDWDFIGVSVAGYQPYWELCKREWISCQNRQSLVAVLSARIQPRDAPFFPWSTKITELCIAGSRRSNLAPPKVKKKLIIKTSSLKNVYVVINEMLYRARNLSACEHFF
jgi:hypothetical protein